MRDEDPLPDPLRVRGNAFELLKESIMDLKRLIYIVLGPALLGVCVLAFRDVLGMAGAEAHGV